MMRSLGILGSILVAVGACELSQAHTPERAPDAPWWIAEGVATPTYVDSVFPIEEALRRFRDGVDEVMGLTGGAASLEALVDAVVRSLEAGEAEGLASLTITRAEFAWLYYPHTIYTSPPYELSPEIVWFQQRNYGSRGLTRLLDRYADKALHYTGLHCPAEGEPFGRGRIWDGCTVLGRLPTGEDVEERLFGSIFEVGGSYKLVSFANDL